MFEPLRFNVSTHPERSGFLFAFRSIERRIGQLYHLRRHNRNAAPAANMQIVDGSGTSPRLNPCTEAGSSAGKAGGSEGLP